MADQTSQKEAVKNLVSRVKTLKEKREKGFFSLPEGEKILREAIELELSWQEMTNIFGIAKRNIESYMSRYGIKRKRKASQRSVWTNEALKRAHEGISRIRSLQNSGKKDEANEEKERLREEIGKLLGRKINFYAIHLTVNRLREKDLKELGIEKPDKQLPAVQDIENENFRKEFFAFLRRGKSFEEIKRHFKINDQELDVLLKKPPVESSIYKDESHNVLKIFCIPRGSISEPRPRIWSYKKASSGGAAVDIIFPDDVGWRKERAGSSEEKKLEKIRIVPISDIWFGDFLHDAPSFDERISWIEREPHVFWFFNGDAIYKLTAADIREGILDELYWELRKKLAPIAHKWLWAQSGCFEDRLASTADGFDPIEKLCAAWNIPYFRTPFSAGIHWAGNLFEFYCVHGKSTAQKKGTKLNAVLRILGEIEFRHFICMSHIKDSIFNKPTRVVYNVRKFDLESKKQYAFICPAFVKYDQSREAKWGYPLPFRGQINCALYKNGDYHLYSSATASGLEEIR